MRTNIGLPRSAVRLLAHFELDKEPATAHMRLILVETSDGEYVVSTQSAQVTDRADRRLREAVDAEIEDDDGLKWSGSWNQGHYYRDLEKAREYFLERCRRRR